MLRYYMEILNLWLRIDFVDHFIALATRLSKMLLRIMAVCSLVLVLALSFILFYPNFSERCLALAPDQGTLSALQRRSLAHWYGFNDVLSAPTAFIFVHGFNSSNLSAWCFIGGHRNPPAFWPEIVRKDTSISQKAIFLLGYEADYYSAHYSVSQAAQDLFQDLRRPRPPGHISALDKKNLIFVAHSAGGVVVREMLYQNKDSFVDKNLGLLLVASPSNGSIYVEDFKGLIPYITDSVFLEELKPGSPTLKLIDSSFNALLEDREVNLCGKELLEAKGIFRLGPVSFERIVRSEDAGGYFGEPEIVSGTNHTTIAKPSTSYP